MYTASSAAPKKKPGRTGSHFQPTPTVHPEPPANFRSIYARRDGQPSLLLLPSLQFVINKPAKHANTIWAPKSHPGKFDPTPICDSLEPLWHFPPALPHLSTRGQRRITQYPLLRTRDQKHHSSPIPRIFLSLLSSVPLCSTIKVIMGSDTDVFHGLPIMGSLQSPGRYSPPGNGHPKQSQQQFPSCTTQAPLPPTVMTDDQARSLSICRTPSIPLSPQRLETFAAGEVPRPSQISLVGEADAAQNGVAGAAPQELALVDQALKQEYLPEDLHQRIQSMWPTRPSESEEYDDAVLQRRASDTIGGPSSFQPAHLSQGDNGYERIGKESRGSINSQIMFQQSYPWNCTPTSATQPPINQSIFYPGHLDVSVDESQADNNPVSYYPRTGNPKRCSDDVDFNLMSTSASFPEYTTSAENVPITSLSPSTSLSFYEAPPAMRQEREDTVPLSDGDNDPEYKDSVWWPEELLGGSPSSIEAPGNKVDEPYAQLIYRAFMSRPNKSMTLQEIYQWFREHTEKAKAEGKGWQNSIRHNLSMNGVCIQKTLASQRKCGEANEESIIRHSPNAIPKRHSTPTSTAPSHSTPRAPTAGNPQSGFSSPTSTPASRAPRATEKATAAAGLAPPQAATTEDAPRGWGPTATRAAAAAVVDSFRTQGCRLVARAAMWPRRIVSAWRSASSMLGRWRWLVGTCTRGILTTWVVEGSVGRWATLLEGMETLRGTATSIIHTRPTTATTRLHHSRLCLGLVTAADWPLRRS